MINENSTEPYWKAIGTFLRHMFVMAMIFLIVLAFTAAMRLVRQYFGVQGSSLWLLEYLELSFVSINVVAFVAFLVHALWTFFSVFTGSARKERQ